MKKVLLAGVVLSGILFISMNINSSVEKPEKYKKACDGGNAAACNRLGLLYYAGQDVEQDNLKAVALFKKACNGGDATGCTFLGFMYNNGIGVEYDTLKAVEFYTKACNGGDTLGCKSLGIMYTKDKNLKQSNFCPEVPSDKASK